MFKLFEKIHLRLLIILILSVIVFGAKASEDVPIIKVLDGSQGQLKVDSAITVNDDYQAALAAGKIEAGAYSRNAVTLRINEAATYQLTTGFVASVTVRIVYTSDMVQYDSVEKTLVINYDTSSTYATSKSYVFSGAHSVSVRVLAISLKRNGTDLTGTDADNTLSSLLLENSITRSPEYTFNCSGHNLVAIVATAVDAGGPADQDNTSTKNIYVTWPAVNGADEYDIEWTYIDSSALANNLYGNPLDKQLIFEHNATRTTVTGITTRIPLIYSGAGSVFIRVRPVHIKNTRRIPGKWSSERNPTLGLGRYNFTGHEPRLNWQSEITFAEDGKKNVTVQYFDGSLRSRQAVSKDYGGILSTVADTKYDYQGRPTIQVMPAPNFLSSMLNYKHVFNQAADSSEYEKSLYDSAAGALCDVAAPAMGEMIGAANYYSSRSLYYTNPNSLYERSMDFVPKASGYVFSQTVYTQDNTGRIAQQGGVGEAFQVGSHDTRYYYGSPSQEELDALFGTSVGNSSHYFKNMVQDANGQVSVSYTDMHGRTIATALAGNAPDNMQKLENFDSSSIIETLTDPSGMQVEDGAVISKKSLLVPAKGDYIFNYALDPQSLGLASCQGVTICYDCLYDLQITITDDCNNKNFDGQPFDTLISNFTLPVPDTTCANNPSAFNVSFTLPLEIGNYEVTKTLRISKRAEDYYRDSVFLKKNTCVTLDSMISYQRSLVSTASCKPACETCMESLGTWTQFRNSYMTGAGIPVADTADYRDEALAAYQEGVANCNLLCNYNAPAENDIRKSMLLDMTAPTGQYADLLKSDDGYSIFYADEDAEDDDAVEAVPVYARPGLNYFDEYGNPESVYSSKSGTYVKPNDLSVEEFTENFKPSWANTLLPYHPEYCKLLQYESYNSSYQWDKKMQEIDTYSNAASSGYFTPTANTAAKDSFALMSTANLNQLNDSLNNYRHVQINGTGTTYTVSLWTMASMVTRCSSGDDAQQQACMENFILHPVDSTFNSSWCAGDLDMAWRNFREMYLNIKREIIDGRIKNADCPQTPSAATLIAAGHYPNFNEVNDAVTQNNLDYDISTAESEDIKNITGSFYQSNCEAYATQWMQQLKTCVEYDQAAYDEIIPKLVAVCTKGSDVDHPYGASSISPDSTNTYGSFEEVINAYNQAHGITDITNCTADLLLQPKPYNQQQVYYQKPVWSKPSDCECKLITGKKSEYNSNHLQNETFSQYLLRKYNTTVTESDLTNLVQSCNTANPTCKFFATPVSLPPLFQCYSGDVCITCDQMATAYNDFINKYDTISLSVVEPDSLQQKNNQLFANFMNNRLGFGKQAWEYLDFMQTCHLSQARMPATTPCDSITNTIADFQCYYASLGDSAVYYGDCGQTYWEVSATNDSINYVTSTDYTKFMKNSWLYWPSSMNSYVYATANFKAIRNMVVDDAFTINFQVKNPKKGCVGDECNHGDVKFQFDTHSINDSLVNTDEDFEFLLFPGTGHGYYSYRHVIHYDTSLDNKSFEAPILVKLVANATTFRIYYGDTLILTVPRDGHSVIDQVGSMQFDLLENHGRMINWVRVYVPVNGANKLIFWEGFNDSIHIARPDPAYLVPREECTSAFAKFYNNRYGTSYTFSDLSAAYYASCGKVLNVCDSVEATLCGKSQPVYSPAESDPVTNCSDSAFFTVSTATERYTAYSDSLKNVFDTAYRNKCLQAYKYETFTVSHSIKEYHYTLYYYDQAGNLLQTIPPDAVVPNRSATFLNQVKQKRAAGDTLMPAHIYTLATNYRYNSLNQVVMQKTPDAGTSSFYYDRLGRLVLSKNAKQVTSNNYSYTSYDAIGRITETGQLTSSATMNRNISKKPAQLTTWLNNAKSTREQITQTVYDLPYTPIEGTVLNAKNLRNRVAYSAVYETATKQTQLKNAAATYYSYDIMGNVDTLVQDFTFNNGNRFFKKVIYNYDLISGNVNSIIYQKDQPDVFYHRYTYDFANKLTNAETSTDSITWENDAFYNYYAHGPLARMVVGEQQVQGMDYAYTLQGWLKGINSTSPGTKFDIGADGRAAEYAPNAMIGRDVFGLALYYYGQSDYSAIKRTNLEQPFANADPLNASFFPLYNGNIAAMSTNFNDVPVNGTNIKPLLYAYQYDQLNRLVQMRAFKSSIGFTNVSNIWSPVAVDDFGEDAAYDANGNITRYRRYGSKSVNLVSATVMDSLSYKYNAGTNQLNYIKDKIGVNAYTTDIDNQGADNYSYDAIGNLTADVKEGISSIEWTVYGKIKTINKTDGTTITYKYDAAGNRVSKTVGNIESWYVRDASGNILSIYTAGDASVNNGHLTWAEADIYGSSRLGTYTPNKDMTVTPPAMEDLPTLGEVGYFATFTRGQKHYELTNHLGNVLAVISDKKIQVSSDNVTVSFCKAYIESANDYYPGGMQMPMRTYTASSSLSYRYGFNGKEKDNEVKGEGNQYDYGFRIYDPRAVRFLSVDPLRDQYPWYTPYQFAGNKPIVAIDLDGLEEKTVIRHLGRYDGPGQDGSFYIKSTDVTIDHNARFFNYSDDGKVTQQAITQVYAEYQGQTAQVGYVAEDVVQGGITPSAEYDYTQNIIPGKSEADSKYAGWNPVKWAKTIYRDANAPDNAETVSNLQDVGAVLLTQINAYSLLKRSGSSGVSATKPPTNASNNGVGAMKRLKYEAAPYHGKVDNILKSRAPINGQEALDNSLQVKITSPRRIGVDYDNNEFVIFDETGKGSGIYHGHVRAWNDLLPEQQNTLKGAGMVNDKGKILNEAHN